MTYSIKNWLLTACMLLCLSTTDLFAASADEFENPARARSVSPQAAAQEGASAASIVLFGSNPSRLKQEGPFFDDKGNRKLPQDVMSIILGHLEKDLPAINAFSKVSICTREAVQHAGVLVPIRCCSVDELPKIRAGSVLYTFGSLEIIFAIKPAALSDLPHMPKLQTLILSSNYLQNAGAMKLAGMLPHLKHLQTLNLMNNQIGPVGFKELAPTLPQTLRKLNLSDNDIGADGAIALAEHLPSTLQELNLNYNGIGDKGAIALAGHLPSTLQKLQLFDNQIGDTGAKALADHLPPTLESWDLRYNSIGIAVRTKLKETFPQINILFV